MRRLSCDRIGAFALLRNFARNSPATVSRYELKVLKLQRFRALLKVHAIELRATLGEKVLSGATGTAGGACKPHSASGRDGADVFVHAHEMARG